MQNYTARMQQMIYGLTVCCAFLLPSNFLIGQIGVVLVFLWIVGGSYGAHWSNMRRHPLLWLFLVFGVLYVFGCFWSANKAEALASVSVKASILFFPLVFASVNFDYAKTKLILQAFLAGLICVGIFMVVRPLFTTPPPDVDEWSYQELSRNISHPAYLSLYYVVGIMICFHGILLRDVPMNKKALAVGFVLFFCILIFMLASKTGLISLVMVFLFYIGYAIVRFRRYVVAGAALVALLAGFFIAMQLFPAVSARMSALKEALTSNQPIDPTSSESTAVRLLIWQQDLQIISENLLTGVGTGDVQDELMKKYQAAGMTGAYEKKLNAHSQYFQTGIALGLPGMVLLIGIFLASFTIAIRRRFGFAALFAVLLAFNFIPESMLQLQAGTFLFGFLFTFILFAADPAVLSPKSSAR